MYFVIGRDGVIYYPARGLGLLSIDRFSLLRSSFTCFGLPVDNLLVQTADLFSHVGPEVDWYRTISAPVPCEQMLINETVLREQIWSGPEPFGNCSVRT